VAALTLHTTDELAAMSAVYAPLPTITSAFVNPAHMNAAAGPSSNVTKKKPASCPKRKRTDTPDSGTESAALPRKARDGPKKKKANRACFHCQKAHLTCDDCMCRVLFFLLACQ